MQTGPRHQSRGTIGPLPSSAVNVILNVSGDAMDNGTVILFKMCSRCVL